MQLLIHLIYAARLCLCNPGGFWWEINGEGEAGELCSFSFLCLHHSMRCILKTVFYIRFELSQKWIIFSSFGLKWKFGRQLDDAGGKWPDDVVVVNGSPKVEDLIFFSFVHLSSIGIEDLQNVPAIEWKTKEERWNPKFSFVQLFKKKSFVCGSLSYRHNGLFFFFTSFDATCSFALLYFFYIKWIAPVTADWAPYSGRSALRNSISDAISRGRIIYKMMNGRLSDRHRDTSWFRLSNIYGIATWGREYKLNCSSPSTFIFVWSFIMYPACIYTLGMLISLVVFSLFFFFCLSHKRFAQSKLNCRSI